MNMAKPKITIAALASCPTCFDTGLVLCTACLGDGTTYCRWCSSGPEEEDDEGDCCNYCGGDQELDCEDCNTTGKVACPTCLRKGKERKEKNETVRD